MSIPEDAEKLYTSLFNSETEDQKDQGVIDVTIRYDNSRRLALKNSIPRIFFVSFTSFYSGHFAILCMAWSSIIVLMYYIF